MSDLRHCGICGKESDCLDDILTCPTCSTDRQWISVKDRLPEKSQRVIVWDGEAISLDIYSVAGTAFFAHLGMREYPVTHWMPLPEPPEVNNA